MAYNVPGQADELNENLINKWNETIQAEYEQLRANYGSRFFEIDPRKISNPTPANVHWFGDPAEPNFCIGLEVARQLSDWGLQGRQNLHNEYCEYHTIERPDATGRIRPKRVQITTELREYWVCLAVFDPDELRKLATEILEFEPSWMDLYGVQDPFSLTETQRKLEFSRFMAGNGADEELRKAGIPDQPIGRLNRDNAVFMTHPINGLDDLLYIVMFGAKPYAKRIGDTFQKVTREDIFRAFGVEHLACRHADPAAAMGAYGAVFDGRVISFKDPLGMYILSFADNVFLYEDKPVPKEWIRWKRGQAGMYQRLEFGPDDNDPAFLDDIILAEGANEDAVTGGFQIVQHIEVGPLVIVSEKTPVEENEYEVINTSNEPIHCNEAQVCQQIRKIKGEYDSQHNSFERIGPRKMGWRNLQL